MPKFRCRPIEVDAIQFRASADIEDWPESVEPDPFGEAWIDDCHLEDGDWIVTRPNGETHPVTAEDFAKDYEKIPQ